MLTESRAWEFYPDPETRTETDPKILSPKSNKNLQISTNPKKNLERTETEKN